MPKEYALGRHLLSLRWDNNTIKIIVGITLSLFYCQRSIASRTTAFTSGDWQDSFIWDNGKPTCGDTIFIDTGVTVTVSTPDLHLDEASTPPCSTAMYLEISGELQFQAGFKAYFPCNTHIYLTDSGTVTKGTGWGSSNIISICETVVWKAQDGDVSGPTFIGPGLPITLADFTAEPFNETVLLSWTTSSEINNNYFTINRSYDLKKVVAIAEVPGSGNSRELLSYRYIDIDPGNGTIYYQLKQTDFDGRSETFQWVSVNVNPQISDEFEIKPTYSNGFLTISVSDLAGEMIEVDLLTIEGRILYQGRESVIRDSYQFVVDLNKLSYRGMAIVRLTSFKGAKSFKIFLSTTQ